MESSSTKKQDEKVTRWNTECMLEKIGMGRYQWFNIALVSLVMIYANLSMINYLFTAVDLSYRWFANVRLNILGNHKGFYCYRCKIPECDYRELIFERSWLHNAIPLGQNGKLEKCKRYPFKKEFLNISSYEKSCDNVFDHGANAVKCNQWIFEDTKSSIVPDFGLACDIESISIVGTLHSVGLFIGNLLHGVISDNYGRRTVVIIGSSLSAIFGILRSFSNSFIMFLLLELLESIAIGGVYCTAVIIGMELVVSSKRPLVYSLVVCSETIGGTYLGVVAWWSNNWRLTLRFGYGPALLFITYFWFMDESIRWLRTKGRTADAINVLKKVAIINKRQISEYDLSAYQKQTEDDSKQKTEAKTDSTSVIFQSKELFYHTSILSYIFFISSLMFNGLAITSLNLDGRNKYFNFIVSNLTDIPVGIIMLPVLKSCSRQISLFTIYILLSISCVAYQFADDGGWLQFILFVLCKFMSSMAFSMVFVYCSEIFPTELRGRLTGLCSTIGKIGSMIAPQTIFLTLYFGPYASILLFGLASLLASLLMLLLPDTRNRALTDKVNEGS